ncbi:hypothetical protein C8R45DRAFT_1019747 [Mycena sanguinolenta]|nr:hypothetical protein C8R45DRAFT_1019747 [Mycena sanguinolenta]
MSSGAALNGLPVSVAFDPNVLGCSISLDWVMNTGLRSLNSRVSGLLSLRCSSGVLSMQLYAVAVAATPISELVLGSNWFELACGAASRDVDDVVAFLDSGPLNLSRRSDSACLTEISPVRDTGEYRFFINTIPSQLQHGCGWRHQHLPPPSHPLLPSPPVPPSRPLLWCLRLFRNLLPSLRRLRLFKQVTRATACRRTTQCLINAVWSEYRLPTERTRVRFPVRPICTHMGPMHTCMD